MMWCFTFGTTMSVKSALAPLANGAIAMAMTYMGGASSGAHYNPVVTLALTLRTFLGATHYKIEADRDVVLVRQDGCALHLSPPSSRPTALWCGRPRGRRSSSGTCLSQAHGPWSTRDCDTS